VNGLINLNTHSEERGICSVATLHLLRLWKYEILKILGHDLDLFASRDVIGYVIIKLAILLWLPIYGLLKSSLYLEWLLRYCMSNI